MKDFIFFDYIVTLFLNEIKIYKTLSKNIITKNIFFKGELNFTFW